MPNEYDCIVIGMGGHGSATIAQLSTKLQVSQLFHGVAGIEQFQPCHDKGSSHGKSRIYRQAYFEDPKYVPLLQRSLHLWRQLEKDASTNLLTLCGGMMIGKTDSVVVKGTIRSASLHDLPNQILTCSEAKQRYPIFNLRNDDIAVVENNAGYLNPEGCIEAYLKLAKSNGAELYFGEKMLSWKSLEDNSGNLEVITTRSRYVTKKLVLAVGAWAGEVYGSAIASYSPLHIERRVLYWFKPSPEDMELFKNIPVYIWDLDNGSNFYGFPYDPLYPDEVKVAFHSMHQQSSLNYCENPESVNRIVDEKEIEQVREILQKYIPALNGELVSTATCMYTMTVDEHFIIDFHPDYPDKNVIIASPCSGHGFKFCSVIGEIITDL
eukprot:gene7742-10519_t